MKYSFVIALCVLCGGAFGAEAIKSKSTYKEAYGESKAPLAVDPAKDLPRYPAVEPKDAIGTWQVKKGFKLELAAHEPQVRSPIAVSFDERGRMFVCEMIDYSEMRDVTPHLGRISMLEDKDADGHYETSTVFADDLAWPTGLIWANGGVYVIATPDIWFFKDTKGTGKADVREKVFTGFGTGLKLLNVQGLANCPQWGLDNRIHIQSGGGNRGVITCLKRPDLKGIELGGRDFWFDPRTHEFGLEAGGAQYGMSFDNYGRKFACSNSDHLQFFVYDDRYAGRNPYFDMPPSRQSIAADGGAAEVFRISPDEPWRIVRTRWRIAGVVKGVVEGGGRVSGYFTGATGTTVYRGDAYGDDFVNNTFTGDAGGQLVHRKKIHPNGVSLIGRRPDDEQGFEFAASKDTWVRVVNFANAPDGCLHVIDMHREVIEHPWSIPDEIKKHIDLNSGNDRGRIFRIVPDRADWKRRPGSAVRPGGALLADMTTAELVDTLSHPNGWHRDTAQRLLYERQDKSAVPLLEKLISSSTFRSRVTDQAAERGAAKSASNALDIRMSSYAALAKIHALGALDGLGALNEAILLQTFEDKDEQVRKHAILKTEILFQQGKGGPHVLSRIRQLSSGPDADKSLLIQFQTALSIGNIWMKCRERLPMDNDSWNQGLRIASGLIRNGCDDPWVSSAILSDTHTLSWAFATISDDIAFAREHPRFTIQILRSVGVSGRITDTLDDKKKGEFWASAPKIWNLLTSQPQNSAWIHAFAEGLKRAGTTIAKVDKQGKLAAVFAKSADIARDHKASGSARIDAISLVMLDAPKQAVPALMACLKADQPEPVQAAAVSAFGQFSGNDVTDSLITNWPGLQPKARSAAFAVMLARPERAATLLHAIEAKKIAATELTASDVQSLFKHKDKSVSALAAKVLAELKPPSRASVIAKYQPALTTKGDAARGQIIFTQRCMACHKANNLGVDVAPPLVTVKTKGRDGIFAAILDPNKEIAPPYIAYTVNTKDGQTLAGIITHDTANSVTIKMMGGAELTVPRSNIKGSASTGASLMPEGIETGMSVADMADLLDFIESLK